MSFENETYSINMVSHELTKEDIIIDYQLNKEIDNFTYTVSKDGKKLETIKIVDSSNIRIIFKETGEYTIEFQNYYKNGTVDKVTTGIYKIDKEGPVIKTENEIITLAAGKTFNSKSGVSAYDNMSGDLTSKITTNENKLDFTTIGDKKLIYEVKDEAGNVSQKTITVQVIKNNESELMLRQFTIFGILLVVLFIILGYYRSIVVEKRIGRFSIEPKGKSKNIYEKLLATLDSLIETLAEWLNHFKWIIKYSNRYEKYQVAFQENSTMIIVAKKFAISILFFILSVFAFTIKFEVMSFFEMILSLLVGFYIMDFVYLFKYKFYRDNVENDLLQAIVIMNNSFKAGKSIPQAIEIVSTELDSGIAREFKKMRMELSMGLSLETVFERFSERIEIIEISYLTSSLMILNQTGGNIIKVFNSIEKSLMNKKKLRLEMKALTSSAKFVTYLLIGLPIIFMIIISIVSPNYFLPLIDNPTGLLISAVIILIYILYTYVVRIIMKVRM